MRVAIVYNHRPETLAVVQELEKLLAAHRIVRNDDHPEVVVTVGGDGTLLKAFHRYLPQIDHVRFIGVHTGHLGFYTDWRNYDVDRMVDALSRRQPASVSYPLLQLKITAKDGIHVYTALNETTLKGIAKTLEARVYIKNEFFESFRGDGLCVSTPTGSTAYSKSLGGAVIHPRLKALQMTEIASINNRVFRTLSSPIVIAPDEWITIVPGEMTDFVVTLDGHQLWHRQIEKLEYRISSHVIRFDKFEHTHFWSRVEDAFIGWDDTGQK